MRDLGRYDSIEVRREIAQRSAALIIRIQEIVKAGPGTTSANVRMISELRACGYEEINQVQHSYLILRATDWLVREMPSLAEAHWQWHPEQTSGDNEPDLRATLSGEILISAEITTSPQPKGTLRKRMKETLEKLSSLPGAKFYFVQSEPMQAAAARVVERNVWDIRVVDLQSFHIWD